MRSSATRRMTLVTSNTAWGNTVAPRSSELRPFDVPGSRDFNAKSFRSNVVLRWEWKPGSTLFVVWQQARENDLVPGGFQFGRDAQAIFGVPPHNVFLVKLSYWLNN